jgi:hypothetical protein
MVRLVCSVELPVSDISEGADLQVLVGGELGGRGGQVGLLGCSDPDSNLDETFGFLLKFVSLVSAH